MSIDEAISMEPVKIKLKNLREHMPDQMDITYDFGAYLADRLNSELVPQGFNMAAELAIYDLKKGVNGFTGETIENNLVGYPLGIYEVLKIQVPQIAKAVCPEEFSKGVKDFYDQINAITEE